VFWWINIEDGPIPLEKKRTGINSSLSYRYKAVSCGLDISASCEHGNEISVGIFPAKIDPESQEKFCSVEGVDNGNLLC
jgi:hypothetical protein